MTCGGPCARRLRPARPCHGMHVCPLHAAKQWPNPTPDNRESPNRPISRRPASSGSQEMQVRSREGLLSPSTSRRPTRSGTGAIPAQPIPKLTGHHLDKAPTEAPPHPARTPPGLPGTGSSTHCAWGWGHWGAWGGCLSAVTCPAAGIPREEAQPPRPSMDHPAPGSPRGPLGCMRGRWGSHPLAPRPGVGVPPP